MEPPKDHVSDLERHMRILEAKIDKLRASLAHWQKWYMEYLTLQENVSELPPDPPPRKELARIRRDFESEILTKKEINEIFGKNDLKSRDQILSVLSRRVDYVEQNIASLEKLVETEENKLAAVSVIAQPDAGVDEETGLPIMDIVEHLDDDDNVIDFKLQSGGDVEPKILEALKKVGINDLSNTKVEERTSPPKATGKRKEQPRAQPEPSPAPKAPKEVLVPDESDDEKSAPRKTVSFAEDTKPGHEGQDSQRSRAAQELEQIMQSAKEQEAMDLSTAVLPEDETAEDRELRRQMLQYGMSEIGPVVAELEIEEADSDDDDELYDETDEDDSEDDLGRSKRSVITDDYIQRMKELEKRLGVQSAFTVAPHQPKTEVPEEGIGVISVKPESDSAPEATASGSKGKKSVKFATEVHEDKSAKPKEIKEPKEPKVNPLGDVLERTGDSRRTLESSNSATTKRPSRFKKERGAPAAGSTSLPKGPHQVPSRIVEAESEPSPFVPPTGPEGQTIANTVVERDVSSTPRDPDEFDSQLLHQAATVEYNRLRNRMIQRQGGFMKEEESPISEVVDEEDEPPQRVSRFMAARLSQK